MQNQNVITVVSDLLYQIDRVLELFSKHSVGMPGGDPPRVIVYNLDKYLAKKLVVHVWKDLHHDASFYSNYNAIIQKLVDDGMLSEKDAFDLPPESRPEEYNITFKGRLWFEAGGYQGERNRLNAENTRVNTVEKRQRAYESNMVLLTWILAIGTSIAALYYLLEIQKNHSDFWNKYYPAAFCLLMPTMLTLLLWQILKRKQQQR